MIPEKDEWQKCCLKGELAIASSEQTAVVVYLCFGAHSWINGEELHYLTNHTHCSSHSTEFELMIER